jgi:hypothetical protein
VKPRIDAVVTASGASASDQCAPCAAGTLGAAPGATSCTSCAAGRYSAAAAATASAACGASTYQASTGEASCADCIGEHAHAVHLGQAAANDISRRLRARLAKQTPTARWRTRRPRPPAQPAARARTRHVLGGQQRPRLHALQRGRLPGKLRRKRLPALLAGALCGRLQGFFSAPEASACEACGVGFYSAEVAAAGASSCVSCCAGTYSGAVVVACDACAAGRFQARTEAGA